MTNEEAKDLLAMIEVIEPNVLIVNSWWMSFVNDYEEALQMAIKALEQQKKTEYEQTYILEKTGKWIGDKCSKCGNERAWYGNNPLFCPDCGARMVNE